MLQSTDRLAVNSREVAAEVIDGEAIIMNLSNGMYYSMESVGAVVWDWLGRGHTIAELADGLSTHYGVPAGEARTDVEHLVGQLVKEGLIQVSQTTEPGLGQPLRPAAAKLEYRRPDLNSFGDMAELLALDPPMPTPTLSPWAAPENKS